MPKAPLKNLFCFGLGFTGSFLAGKLQTDGWGVSGTCREVDRTALLASGGLKVFIYNGDQVAPDLIAALKRASHILVTIPPRSDGEDRVLEHFGEIIKASSRLKWLGYLSTTGVYGNRNGEWVDEASELKPTFDHQKRRAEVEQRWMTMAREQGAPVHIFRLAGIYGPGRNLIERVRQGKVKRIDQPGLVFNRVHVADVAQTLIASMNHPSPGSVYNVADDLPSAPAEAAAYACQLLGVDVPPLMSLQEAELSEMGRSFYLTHKRVSNRKIKREPAIQLLYPDYQKGLQAILNQEKNG